MLARRSSRIALTDARVDHAASCPQCMARLLALRQKHRRQRRMWIILGAIALLLLFAVAVTFILRYPFP